MATAICDVLEQNTKAAEFAAHASITAGSAMMEYVLARLQREGCKSVILWVFEANTRARKFYEQHGFALAGQKRLANGIAELMFAKDI